MRLQLSLAIVLAAVPAGADPEAPRASAALGVYADNDDMLVISPSAGAQVPVGDALSSELGVQVDSVTGASVDVVTSASPRAIHEQREQVSVGLIARLPHYLRLTARAIGSHEHDYDVVHGWLLASMELADRNTVVELGYDHGHAWVRDVVDPAFHATRRDDRAALRVSQILDRRTYVDVLADVSRIDGYEASPYRMVTIDDPASPTVMRVREVTPTDRRALAGAIRARRAVGDHWFVHGGYRAVIDSWHVISHTADVLVITDLGARTHVGASARGYLQSAADFFQPRYALADGMPPALRTRDRTLGTMRSLSLELVGDRALGRDVSVQLAIGGSWFWWPEDPLERERMALTSTTSVTRAW